MQITDETVHKRTISATLSLGDLQQLVAEAVAKRAGLTLHAWYPRTVDFQVQNSLFTDLKAEVTITVDHMAPPPTEGAKEAACAAT